MRFILGLITIVASLGAVSGDHCAEGSTDYGGNWFCQPVKAIHYSNVGTPGTYQKITGMSNGVCTSETQLFSGPIAPLDEEVSVHIRGPFALKQFAAYGMYSNASSSETSQSTNGNDEAKTHRRSHGHQRFHRGHHDQEKRADIVSAIINGVRQSWIKDYFGPGVASAVAPKSTPQSIPPPPPAPVEIDDFSTDDDDSSNTTSFADGTYHQIGYYNSATGTSHNLTFIGNYGGSGSGTFDYKFGSSTAYLNSAGTGGASSSQVLSDTTIPSNKEFSIFTSKPCIAGDSCGFTRPKAVAYHGFTGADKIFLFEFQMPSDGTTGFNADMPALWMLNAQIPRTMQYDQSDCSCWISGCGEFDILEVLSSGSTYCKSTLHTNTPAGDSDYISRPTNETMKLAVFFHSLTSAIRIQVLPDRYVFGRVLDQSDVEGIMNMTRKGPMLSEFKVPA